MFINKIMWKVTPLKSCILIILKKYGVILEKDLDIVLRKLYGEYSLGGLNKALMTLETKGFIHVINISKKMRRIQLLTKDMTFLAVGED